MTMPAETHYEVAEDGVKRLHAGYFAMQCPVCKQQFLLGKPQWGQVTVASGGLCCGRAYCMEQLGIGMTDG